MTGGGRYDKLIHLLSNGTADFPACGTTIGLERIYDVMNELDMFPALCTKTQILLTIFDENSLSPTLQFAQQLRSEGINVEVYLNEKKNLGKQISYAGKRNIPLIGILGPDEINENIIVIRQSKENQIKVEWTKASDYIRKLLDFQV